MLSGGEQHALLHQAGGIAYACDVVSLRLNVKIVEVRATEDDFSVGRSWEQADVSENPGVKANTFSRRLSRYSGLEHCPSLKYHVVCHGFPALSIYFSNL